MNHEFFMEKAIKKAQKALDRDEFPVGCVIVYENKVIASGERKGTANGLAGETDHAEMIALRNLEALNLKIDKTNAVLYCTMEPCLMCYGAILLSGIGTIVYAYEDVMGGGTQCDLSLLPPLYSKRKIKIISNILRKQSLDLFQKFFSNHNYWKGSLLAEYTLEQR